MASVIIPGELYPTKAETQEESQSWLSWRCQAVTLYEEDIFFCLISGSRVSSGKE
jgi:hypothetical protein